MDWFQKIILIIIAVLVLAFVFMVGAEHGMACGVEYMQESYNMTQKEFLSYCD